MTKRKGNCGTRGGSRARDGAPRDEAILSRITARDKSALLDLHARLAPGLLGLAFQINPDRMKAAAIVEETFVRLWREAHCLPRDSTSVAVWLVLKAREIALAAKRPKGSRGLSVHDQVHAGKGAYSWLPRVEDVARLQARRVLLKKTLRQLPTQQGAALAFAVWEGLNEQEIAERLGEPLARTQASIRAGMRFIRHRMRVVIGTWSARI